MAASNYDACLKKTLAYEGGYTNDPRDPGGPTNWGITIADARMYWKKNATASDVKAMPLSVAKTIYRQRYWDKMGCDKDPAGVDLCVFDYGVNSGVGRAVPLREKTRQANAAQWVKDYCAARLAFLHRLRTWSAFGKGWGSRVVNVEATGVSMALSARGLPPAEVSKDLKKESDAASKQSKKELGKTIVAPASTSGALIGLPTWSLWVLGAVAVATAAYFGYRWYIHNARAQAFMAAAIEVENEAAKRLEDGYRDLRAAADKLSGRDGSDRSKQPVQDIPAGK